MTIPNDESNNQGDERPYDLTLSATVVHTPEIVSSHLISLDADYSLPGLGVVDDADIIRVDVLDNGSANFSKVFDGTENGLSVHADVDAFTPYEGGFLVSLDDWGQVGDLEYGPYTVLQVTTTGRWSEYGFDPITERGLWSNIHGNRINVDAISFSGSGLVLSISNNDTQILPSDRSGEIITVEDTDLIAPRRRAISLETGWAIVASGQSLGLDPDNPAHDVDALSIASGFPTETRFLSTLDTMHRIGGSIENRDVFSASSHGHAITLDGSQLGIPGNIDGYARISIHGTLGLQPQFDYGMHPSAIQPTRHM